VVMATRTIIDGNNLLYAMHEHAPLPAVGRETLVKIVSRWARKTNTDVTIVFDGPPSRWTLGQQVKYKRVALSFAAPRTADDVIIEMIRRVTDPGTILIVSTDTAIRYEARRRRCSCSRSAEFVAELFAIDVTKPDRTVAPEKPEHPSPEETEKWLDVFGSPEVADQSDADTPPPPTSPKPATLPTEETEDWLTIFGFNDEDDAEDDSPDGDQRHGRTYPQ